MKKTDMKHLALSLILVVALLLGAGCALVPEVATAPPAGAATNTTTPTASEKATLAPSLATSPAPLLPSIADVIAKVKPSVVAINSKVTTRDFFDRPFTQEIPVGSGWIIDERGYVVTNNHVAQEAAPNIIVILDDGRVFDAQIVGADQLTDLAVLKIDADNLTASAVGDSSRLRVGDWVVAIGNSLGQGIRATQGIVSRQGASVQVDISETLYGLVETDAAINPGNSGGPLVSMAGEVIGITSVKLVRVEVEGVGYAISTEVVMPIIRQLIATGSVAHPWLGVSLYSVNEYSKERFNLTVDKGALITEVVLNSPADAAGLKTGDVIISFAGKKTDTVDDLIQAIRATQVGQSVEIVYWSGNTQKTTSATLGTRPTFP